MLAAPFVKEQDAKRFIRARRQAGYWDPHHAHNVWGYTVQEQVQWSCCVRSRVGHHLQDALRNTFSKASLSAPQANEYWTALRADAQYYIDMSNLMFDRSVAT